MVKSLYHHSTDIVYRRMVLRIASSVGQNKRLASAKQCCAACVHNSFLSANIPCNQRGLFHSSQCLS